MALSQLMLGKTSQKKKIMRCILLRSKLTTGLVEEITSRSRLVIYKKR